MIKKVFSVAVLFLVLVIFVPFAHAEGEFATSYNVTYDVGADGVTQVTEGVTLKNLTDRYYASSFTLAIGSTQVTDVEASDSQGSLQVDVSNQGKKTQLIVHFNQQLTGKDKEYIWSLKFKSKDFANKAGKTWQVTVPKIASVQGLSQYNLTLSVPVGLGDPTTILPEPQSRTETYGKLNFLFTKDQLTDSGVLANFGTNQFFDYKLTFKLNNKSFLPTLAKLPLPMDTPYQEVLINSVEPKPEQVSIDEDGNYIAWFKLEPRQSFDVKVAGVAKLFINRRYKSSLSQADYQKYTSQQKYWEKDSPIIKNKLAEIFKDKHPATNQEKARLIQRFVSNFLQYSETRLKKGDFQRLGSLTALANPDNALCSEFTDLFIALSRAADVPARALVGYGYSANADIRPLSFAKSLLHVWPEYYDSALGWVMVDPTWESTTGGVDYFSKFDLSHLVLGIRGSLSDQPTPAEDVKVEFFDGEFRPEPKLLAKLEMPTEIFAGIPAKVVAQIINQGNSAYPASPVTVSSSKIELVGVKSFTTPPIPPFGFLEYQYDLRVSSLWQSFEDILQLKVGDQAINKKVLIKPFFEYKYFSLGIIGLIVAIVLIYTATLILHIRYYQKSKK